MHDVRSVSPEDILESLVDAIFTVNHELKITSLNKSAEQIIGVSRNDVLGRRCADVFRSNLCGVNCPLLKAFASGQSGSEVHGVILDDKSQLVEVRVTSSLLRDAGQNVVGGVETMQLRCRQGEDAASMERAVQACEVQSIIAALRRNRDRSPL